MKKEGLFLESNNALSAIQDLDDRFLDEAIEWTENRVHMRRSIGIIGSEAILAYVSVQTIPTLLTDHSDAPGSFQKVEGASAMRIPIRLGKTVTLRLAGSAQEGYTAQIVA